MSNENPHENPHPDHPYPSGTQPAPAAQESSGTSVARQVIGWLLIVFALLPLGIGLLRAVGLFFLGDDAAVGYFVGQAMGSLCCGLVVGGIGVSLVRPSFQR